MLAKIDDSFLPEASQRPHRWARYAVELPRQVLEADFPRKVQAHARFRRQWPRLLPEQVSSILPSPNGTPNVSVSSTRPSTAPDSNFGAEPKYLLTARIPRQRNFKLGFHRPSTAPELQNSIDSVPEMAIEDVREESPLPQIVEPRRSISIIGPRGPQSIPRHQWLVLEPPTPGAEASDGFAGRRLFEAFGGGEIPEESAALLRLVPEDRLHVVAAEANFKRASRGVSLLALRHAAYALEMLGHREREVQTGVMSMPLRSCRAGTDLEDSLAERLRRVERMVCSAAVAAKQRAGLAGLSQPRMDVTEAKVSRPLCGILRGNVQLQKGVQALDEFQDFVVRRHGNSVRAWFNLDPEENMKIGEKVFIRRVLDLGFQGNIAAMYKYIDSDRSGSISILELDASAAVCLAQFKKLIDDKFKGNPDNCFQMMDHNRSGRICKDDLVNGLERIGCSNLPPEELFELLDRQGFGYVVSRDLSYLKTWKPRPYLFVEADHEALRKMKETFCQIVGPPLFKTWRYVLDTNCTMRVNWDEFLAGCKRLAREASAKGFVNVLSSKEEDIAAVWRALDDDCSGWIALKEFDPQCFRIFKGFKSWAEQEHGGVVSAFKALDANANGRLNAWELKKAENRPNGYPGDVDALFDYLDLDKSKSLGEAEVRFMDTWDIAWEEFEERSRNKRKTTTAATWGRPLGTLPNL